MLTYFSSSLLSYSKLTKKKKLQLHILQINVHKILYKTRNIITRINCSHIYTNIKLFTVTYFIYSNHFPNIFLSSFVNEKYFLLYFICLSYHHGTAIFLITFAFSYHFFCSFTHKSTDFPAHLLVLLTHLTP